MATRMRVARRAVRRGRSRVARPSAARPEGARASEEIFDVASCFVHSTFEPAEVEPAEVAPAAEPEPAARPSYSRPPAPLLALTPPLRAEAPEEEEDPNATTLPSVDFETPSRPRASSVAVVEAEDEPPSTRKVGWLHQPVPGFVPESEEPALDDHEALADAEAELEPTPTLEGAFFRERHASLLPVVDDVEPLPEPELLTPEQSRRRARLRRGVGIGVTVAALLTLGLAAKAAITPAAPHAERRHAAALVNTEIPQLDRPAVAPPALPSPAPVEEEKSEEASPVGDDPVALGKEAVRLLNERKPEQAAAVARRLVALQPDNAYGYRCLGAALQDLGDYRAARAVYSECVTTAVRGDVQECGALGGTKHKR